MASSYTALDPTVPAGTQTGPQVPTSARANDTALWYAIMHGGLPAWTFSTSGGTIEEPTVFLWTGPSNHRVRATNTWSNGRITQQAVEVSQDGGSAWASVMTRTYTYDPTTNAVTATSGGSGGWMDFIVYVLGKIKSAASILLAHINATGTAVHSLGTMATQAAASVAISGGTINNTAIGLGTPAEGRFTRATETIDTYTPGPGGAVTISWASGGAALVNNTGTHTVTFSNVPTNCMATHVVACTNFNGVAWPGNVYWGASGKPSIPGLALVQLVTLDSGYSYYGIVAWRGV